jgi:hypothetical protein
MRSFVLLLVGLPVVILLVNRVTDGPALDAAGWMRLAKLAVPVLAVSSLLDAFADRRTSQLARVYGKGFAVAMVILVVGSADRPEGWWDSARLMKTLLILPVAAVITAVGFWGQERVFGRENSASREAANV